MVSSRFINGLALCHAAITGDSCVWAVPDRAIETLLAEKWQASASVLLADETQQLEPVTRMLIGYVALASNHTNDVMATPQRLQTPFLPFIEGRGFAQVEKLHSIRERLLSFSHELGLTRRTASADET